MHQMDLSQIEQWGDRPFAEPVQLEGYVQNRAGIVTVHYTASYLLSTACARCLDPVERRVRQDFDHTVVRKLNQQEDDDYIVCEDGILDLDLIAQDDILLELPIRMFGGLQGSVSGMWLQPEPRTVRLSAAGMGATGQNGQTVC